MTRAVPFCKIFVRRFYQDHATFFLFVIGLAGGFMRGPDHLALAGLFVASPVLLAIPCFLWALYALKIVRFNHALLALPENEFLFQYSLYPLRTQWVWVLAVSAGTVLPAVLYGGFLVAVAVTHRAYMAIVLVLAALSALILVVGAQLRRALLCPHAEHSSSRMKQLLDRSFTRPFWLFFPEWIARRNLLQLAATNVFGVLLLLATAYLYSKEPYDARLMAMAVAAVMGTHTQLLWELQQFENVHVSLLRQLPLSMIERLGYTLVSILLLVVPECGVIITYFSHAAAPPVLAGVLCFGLSVLIFINGLLYRRSRAAGEGIATVFLFVMGLIVLVLFRIPLGILAGANAATGIYLWWRGFCRFEPVIAK